MSDEPWWERAACRGRPIRMFVPDVDEKGHGDVYEAGRAICATCPVQAECLEDALSMPWYSRGLWGGKSMKERQAMPHTVRVQPIKHGTVGGDRAHRRRGERPCEDCRRAANAYWCERNGRAG